MAHQQFSLVPDFRAATLTVDHLKQLTEILQSFHISSLQITGSGRLRVAGIDHRLLHSLSQALQPLTTPVTASWLTSLQACPGQAGCRHGCGDGAALAARIEAIEPETALPAKIKIGIAGCPRCCTEPLVRDIGVIATPRGWKLCFGGNGGGRPRIADTIGTGLSEDQVIALLRRCLEIYGRNSRPGMRTARFLESFGLERFRQMLRGPNDPKERGSGTPPEGMNSARLDPDQGNSPGT
ncbi:MAG: NAD(P)/FAD-dependent oxidoreductase [Desulfopila sp.]